MIWEGSCVGGLRLWLEGFLQCNRNVPTATATKRILVSACDKTGKSGQSTCVKEKPTIRSLAATLGLSRSAVSAALLKRSNISKETQESVRRAAEEAGYCVDARLSQLMSYLRSGKGSRNAPNIAWLFWGAEIGIYEQKPWVHGYVQGARDRAHSLGYSLDLIQVDSPQCSLQRLNAILIARGIEGLILPNYALPSPLESSIRWQDFALASVNGRGPGLPHVGSLGLQGMEVVFENLLRLGYRRPGLVIGGWVNAMSDYQWTAGFLQHQRQLPSGDQLRILEDDSWMKALGSWMKARRPDVVICSANETIDCLTGLGYSVPQDVGVVHLNICSDVQGWAGLDQLHEQIGAASVDMVTAQLNRGERGLSIHPKHIFIRGQWVDGWTCPART